MFSLLVFFLWLHWHSRPALSVLHWYIWGCSANLNHHLSPLSSLVTPCISVHDSWRRTELVKDESSETQSNVWVPKLTKTSVTWQKLKLQGFQFWHFYQWTEMKKSFLCYNNCSHCRSSLIRHCLPNPNLNWNEVKHLAPCTTSIPCFPSHLLRLSFACFCCS